MLCPRPELAIHFELAGLLIMGRAMRRRWRRAMRRRWRNERTASMNAIIKTLAILIGPKKHYGDFVYVRFPFMRWERVE